ncbi:MAG: DUF3300 domain-containing protein [bacterium]|nr:DUF3300 domain-containing protein [bacterium]
MRNAASLKKQLLLLAAIFLLLIPASAKAAGKYSANDIDQILAPIALYPDSLLGNVMVASTYPQDVTAANNWIQNNPGRSMEQISAALEGTSWDQSVQALLMTPDVLSKMAGDMAWTSQLSYIFINQTDEMYESIQRLRSIAYDRGALKSTDNVTVVKDNDGSILIGSPRTEVIVVPTYQPAYVYGWTPGEVFLTSLITWGTVAVINDLFWGSCWDWRHRYFWWGPGYGYCGYWNGCYRPWGPYYWAPPRGPVPPPYRPEPPYHHHRNPPPNNHAPHHGHHYGPNNHPHDGYHHNNHACQPGGLGGPQIARSNASGEPGPRTHGPSNAPGKGSNPGKGHSQDKGPGHDKAHNSGNAPGYAKGPGTGKAPAAINKPNISRPSQSTSPSGRPTYNPPSNIGRSSGNTIGRAPGNTIGRAPGNTISGTPGNGRGRSFTPAAQTKPSAGRPTFDANRLSGSSASHHFGSEPSRSAASPRSASPSSTSISRPISSHSSSRSTSATPGRIRNSSGSFGRRAPSDSAYSSSSGTSYRPSGSYTPTSFDGSSRPSYTPSSSRSSYTPSRSSYTPSSSRSSYTPSRSSYTPSSSGSSYTPSRSSYTPSSSRSSYTPSRSSYTPSSSRSSYTPSRSSYAPSSSRSSYTPSRPSSSHSAGSRGGGGGRSFGRRR